MASAKKKGDEHSNKHNPKNSAALEFGDVPVTSGVETDDVNASTK